MEKAVYLRTMIMTIILVAVVCPDLDATSGAAITGSEAGATEFTHVAVMPFFQGRFESPETPLPQPLNRSLLQLGLDRQSLGEGAQEIMTRLMNRAMAARYPQRLVPAEEAAQAYTAIQEDKSLDTPRKQAVALGNALGSQLVVVGTVWRFREKGAVTSDSPASVGFAAYLVETQSGKRLWQGAFEGTQKMLSENVLGGQKSIKMGLRWLTATELARHGVKETLRTFPKEHASLGLVD